MLEKILVDSPIPASELIESETLKLRDVDSIPQPCLTLRTPRQNWGTDRLIAELGFDYAGAYVPIIRPGKHRRPDRPEPGRPPRRSRRSRPPASSFMSWASRTPRTTCSTPGAWNSPPSGSPR